MEVLVTLGVVSSIVALAVFAINYTDGSRSQKLRSNVAMLNSAARLYEANGGDLSGIRSHREVIARLKTVSSNWKEIAGLRKGMVDSRLDFEESSENGELRAIWVPEKRRFELTKSGAGIANFVMSDALSEEGVVEEERFASLELAEVDLWVWDFEDRDIETGPDPLFAGVPSGSSNENGDSETLLVLDPPTFSVSGGAFPMEAFELVVTLGNPNPGGSSVVMYSATAGDWQEYAGETIAVGPGTSIEAYAASRESGWTDSARVLELYTLEEMSLEIAMNFDQDAYNFMELGGTMIPGIYEAVLANPGIVSMDYISDEQFKYLYDGLIRMEQTVTDGNGIVQVNGQTLFLGAGIGVTFQQVGGTGFADPQELPADSDTHASNGGNVPGSNLSNAEIDAIMNGNLPITASVPIHLGLFGNSDSTTIEVVANSIVPEFVDSTKTSVTLEVEKMELAKPIITEQERPDGLTEVGVHYVSMDLEITLGNMPAGARIFYTTDGSDPGSDGNGGPSASSARLYEGPFLVAQPRNVPIRARVYGPEGHAAWFEESPVEKIVWPPPPEIGFTMDMSTTNSSPGDRPSSGGSWWGSGWNSNWGGGGGSTGSASNGGDGGSGWDGGFFNNAWGKN